MVQRLCLLHSTRLSPLQNVLTTVDSQQTDKIKNTMRLLKTDMEDVNGRLSVERGQYEQAADEKQKAEELAV